MIHYDLLIGTIFIKLLIVDRNIDENKTHMHQNFHFYSTFIIKMESQLKRVLQNSQSQMTPNKVYINKHPGKDPTNHSNQFESDS